MKSLGYYSGAIHGEFDEEMKQALRSFIGNENFEDRTDLKIGKIDKPVYDYLVQKFSS
jgi:hypothetical protein